MTFPVELPDFQATWWPVHMETIPGSGEAISIAAIVRAHSGQAQIRQSISPVVLAGLFDSAGKDIVSIVGMTVVDLQNQLDTGVPVERLDMPFGGFNIGFSRECVARDINEVFDIAVRFSSIFGQSNFGVKTDVTKNSRQAFDDWAEQIRSGLLGVRLGKERPELCQEEFNVRVKLNNKYVKIGFLRRSYAANFGVMRPGNISGDTRSLKVKVFDLEAVRRDQLYPLDCAEVLIGCPSMTDIGYMPRRDRESFAASLEFLESEAKARSVLLVRFSSASEAVEHLAKMAKVA